MNIARRLVNTATVAVMAPRQRMVPYWSPDRIQRAQRRRLRAIVEHAYASVPFYMQAMRERGIRPRDIRSAHDLSMLPLIDAGMLRADEHRFLSTRVPEARRRVLRSSGSQSGHHARVWWDEGSLLRKLAYLERDRAVIAGFLGRGVGHRQLYLLPLASQSFLLRDWWNEWTFSPARLATRTLEPADSPYERILERVRAERPDVVYAYGSFSEHFARWLASRTEHADVPGVWCYGGDGMTSPGRALLERVTGSLVYSTYQSTETGRLGFECERRDGWHLNTDLCAVRLVDEAGATVHDGAPGEVVISNLHNRATVLLNYRLGDRATLAATPCACGRGLPVLRALLGRTSDVVHLADGRAISGLLLQTQCTPALEGTLCSQLVPEGPGRIAWRVVLAPGTDVPALERLVHDALRASFGDALSASIVAVEALPTPPHGKFPRVAHRDNTVPTS